MRRRVDARIHALAPDSEGKYERRVEPQTHIDKCLTCTLPASKCMGMGDPEKCLKAYEERRK